MKKLRIKRDDLNCFNCFAKENKIKFTEKCEVYSSTIYFSKTTSCYLNWKEEDIDDEKIKLLVSLINVFIESHELYFQEED